MEEIGACRKRSIFCLKAELGWKSALTERKQKKQQKKKPPKSENDCTEVAEDRRLSGNELLSCTRGIFRAAGKVETAHICARGAGRGTQRMCLKSVSQVDVRLTDAAALRGGTAGSEVG